MFQINLEERGTKISQYADDIAANISNTNINYAFSNMQIYISDLKARLCKCRIKTNADSSTGEIFTKQADTYKSLKILGKISCRPQRHSV
jgi:hypothetical protein